MSEKYQKSCEYLDYVEHFLISVPRATGCVAISAFASLAYVSLLLLQVLQ